MPHKAKAISFKTRFVVGNVLCFVPVMTALLVFFASIKSRWLPLLALKYVLFLGAVAWWSHRRAGVERERIVRSDSQGEALRFGRPFAELAPICGAVVLVGLGYSWSRQDIRWLVICGALGGLLMLGRLLKWFAYDRWAAAKFTNKSAGDSIAG